MKVSLRKANAIQGLINEQIAEKFDATLTISKYDNVADVIEAGTSNLISTISKKFNLIEVLFSLRKKVGQASADVGISDRLTDLAENEKLTAFYKQLASTTAFALPVTQVKQILKDVSEQKDAYGRTKDAVTMNLLTKDSVDIYKSSVSTLRKQKQALSDQLLHLNVSTEIELDEKEVDVLKKYDII
jgi:hypothetical protein